MVEALLTVRSCGPLVSYQDGGRFGMMRFGVPASGPMDRLAHAAANAALGRPTGSTAIEVSMGGLEVACVSGAVTCCVAGGAFQVVHSGVATLSWRVLTLRPGDVLSVRAGRWGSWAYLALMGELVCTRWAGRAATHFSSGLGGGRLGPGAAIVVRDPVTAQEREGELPVPALARPSGGARVVLGPQAARFEPVSIDTLLQASFAVTTARDRMGMRLAGPALVPRDSLSIPSEPVVRGSIQVAGDGAASILLADHQTTGGYPKIATVLSADTDGLTQLRPHDRVSFRAVEAGEAVRMARVAAQARQQFLDGIAAPRGTLDERLMRANLISGAVGDETER